MDSFELEASEPFGVGGEGLGQHLERHVAVELGVLGAVDLAHAALSERTADFKAAQMRADAEGHDGASLADNLLRPTGWWFLSRYDSRRQRSR